MKSINICIACCLFITHINYLFANTTTVAVSKSVFPSNVVPLTSGTPPATPPANPAPTTAAPAITTAAATPPVITPPVPTPPAITPTIVPTAAAVSPSTSTAAASTASGSTTTPGATTSTSTQQVLTSVYIQNNFTHDGTLNQIALLAPGKTEPFIKKNLQIPIAAATNVYSRGSITAFDLTADNNSIQSFNGIQSIIVDTDEITFSDISTGSSLTNPIAINKVAGKWILDK